MFKNNSKSRKVAFIVMILSVCFAGSGHSSLFKRLKRKPYLLLPVAWAIPIAVKKDLIDNFHVVEEGAFYRSAQPSNKNLRKWIKDHGIKTVINLRGAHPGESWWDDEQRICNELGATLFNISLSAYTLSSRENLMTLLDIYDNAQYPMLVHCKGGADRTGEAVAIWMMEKRGASRSQAQKHVTLLYRHFKLKHPLKDLLIEIWGGRDWLENQYDPELYVK